MALTVNTLTAIVDQVIAPDPNLTLDGVPDQTKIQGVWPTTWLPLPLPLCSRLWFPRHHQVDLGGPKPWCQSLENIKPCLAFSEK